MTTLSTLGIDVAKKTFRVALHRDGKVRHQQFANTPAGFAELSQWLALHVAAPVHACLEATGSYSEALARYLYQAGHTVSVVNPARIKAFAQSRLIRTKNDKLDADLIARYGDAAQPEAWTPPPPEISELQALVRHLESLTETRQQLRNRLTDGPQIKVVLASLRKLIAQLEAEIAEVEQQIQQHIGRHPQLKEQAELIDSMTGLGPNLSTGISISSHSMRSTDLAAWAKACQSRSRPTDAASCGSRTRARRRISLRSMCPIRAFAHRLEARGVCKLAIVTAVMRKLLHLVFGVLKTGKKFDPNHAFSA